MAFRRTPSPDRDSPGLKQELCALILESSDHLRTRAELLGLEAREAARLCSRRFAFAVLSLVSLILAYLLALTAAIGILGILLSNAGFTLRNWVGGTLLLAALHLAAALFARRQARRSDRKVALFSATLRELQKDQEWLAREKKN
jgi:uncharacterized membrane protein YqjE